MCGAEQKDLATSLTLTNAAFSTFRTKHGPARLPPPDKIANAGEVIQLTVEQGLCQLCDGTADLSENVPSEPAQLVKVEAVKETRLWVVRQDDVAYADEGVPFGRTLETGVIKHSNLTSGAAAFSGGEMIFVDEMTIVVNGQSGRYGPRSSDEMADVAAAFRKSGYSVWSMGYDEEADFPNPFIGVMPQWVA